MIACFVGTFNIIYWSAWLGPSFKLNFDIEDSVFGYIIALQTLTYVIGCLILPYTCEHSPRRFQFMFAMFGFTVTNWLLGPS